MALADTTVWEMRANGASTNGGGFYDRDPGTSVDYSQQDAAQLSLTDLACVAASTTLTSATGGFTAAMAGNIVYIASGTNALAGWYEITAYSDTNTVTIDRTCASGGDMSAASGKVGGAWAVGGTNEDAFFEAAMQLTGSTIWIKADATHTFSQTVTLAFSSGKRCTIEGYNTTRDDNPTGTDRPLLAFSTYSFSGSFPVTVWSNLRMTGSAATLLTGTSESVYYNIDIVHTGATSAISAGRLAFQCRIVSSGTNTVLGVLHNVTTVSHCLISGGGSHVGVGVVNGYCVCNTIIENHARGILLYSGGCASNCIIYDCTYAVYVPSLSMVHLVNCIAHTGTSFLYGQSNVAAKAYVQNCVVYNYSNDEDATFTGTQVADGKLTSDPAFGEEANGDFSIQTSSPAYMTGYDFTTNISGITI